MEDWNEWAPEACLINLVWGGRENRTEPDSEHFLAWLCCVFFRISFIGVNFFSMSGKSTKIIIACKIFYCLIQAFFFFSFVYLWMTSVQASLYLIANTPPRFWYDRFCTDYHVTVRWHTIKSISRIN